LILSSIVSRAQRRAPQRRGLLFEHRLDRGAGRFDIEAVRQSARIASASCIIFSRLKRSSRRNPMLAPMISYIFIMRNGQSRSCAQSSR
jgi:hypothetical protein